MPASNHNNLDKRSSVTDSHLTCALRICTICGSEKPANDFPVNGKYLKRHCKSCAAERQRIKRSQAPKEQTEKRLAKAREYSERNRTVILAYKKEYHAANAERMREYRKAKYEDPEVRERMQAKARAWRAANPERKAAANKEWAAQNKDKMLAYFRESKAKRRKNPSHRLYASIGAQMRIALRDAKQGRRWESIVGYTLEELMAHLAKQFKPGMTWDNYGKAWHVDHIVPQVSFEFEMVSDDVVRACWSLSNLRPLSMFDNLSKGGKRIHLV